MYFCVYENVKRFDFLRLSSSSLSDLIRCWSLISQLIVGQWCVAGPYVMGLTETDVNTSKRVSVKSGGSYVFSSVNTTSLTFTHVFCFNALTWLVISFFFFRTIYVTTESLFCEFCSFVECCSDVPFWMKHSEEPVTCCWLWLYSHRSLVYSVDTEHEQFKHKVACIVNSFP